MTKLSRAQFIENVLTIAVRSVVEGHHSAVQICFTAANESPEQVEFIFDALPPPSVGVFSNRPKYWLRTNDLDACGRCRSFDQQGEDALRLVELARAYLNVSAGYGFARSVQVTYKFRWTDGTISEVRAQWPYSRT